MESLLRFGLNRLMDKFSDTGREEVPDLSEGKLRGEFRAQFKAMASLRATLVMVGLERGTTWKISVPVKYGEALRLRVQRGIYQVTAWFFADAQAPFATPMLVAIAQGEIRVASERVQKFVLTGRNPLPSQLAEIRQAAPSARPFWLPDEGPRMLPAGAAVTPQIDSELKIVCSPSCAYLEASGQGCSGSPEEDESFCRRHAEHPEAGDSDGMDILAWVGTRTTETVQDPGHS